MLTGIPAPQVPYIWTKVEPWISRATARNSIYRVEDIYSMLMSQEAQLWVYDDGNALGIFITTIKKHPLITFCDFLVVTGKQFRKWEHTITLIEKWAKENGCDQMRCFARLGWAGRSKAFGYKATHTILEKGL